MGRQSYRTVHVDPTGVYCVHDSRGRTISIATALEKSCTDPSRRLDGRRQGKVWEGEFQRHDLLKGCAGTS